MNERGIRRRIERDPELRALYHGKKAKYGQKVKEQIPPPDVVQFHRRIEDMPEAVKGVELAQAVADMDRENYRNALSKYGVSNRQLAKLKALDGLAKDGGRLLSVSLQMTHQNYLGQLHKLADVADDLLERMKGNVMEDGSLQPLDVEDHAALTRCYIETVKEAGKGYHLVMQGTEAMMRMIQISKGDNPDGGAPKKAGWGAPKKVNTVPNAQNKS